MGKEDIRVSRSVAMAIQWVIEDFLVKEYIQAHYMMIHAGRKSLMGKDLHLVREQRRFREGFFICYNEPEDVRPQCAKKNKEENKKVTDGMVSKVAEAQGSGGVISSRGSPTSEAPNGENG